MSVNNGLIKEEGISGVNQICTLQPFEILQVIKEPAEEIVEIINPPVVPENRDTESLMNWACEIMEWVKTEINKNNK